MKIFLQKENESPGTDSAEKPDAENQNDDENYAESGKVLVYKLDNSDGANEAFML